MTDIAPGVAFSLDVLRRLADASRCPTDRGPWLTLTHAVEELERAARGHRQQSDLFSTTQPAAPAQAAE